MNTTIDGILNHRVMLEQPAEGYRVAVDTVLLAASVPTRGGERALDLGCGAGGALLCLAVRVQGVIVTGVEIQPELAELCRLNIARNEFKAEMSVVQGDVTRLSEKFTDYDHVFMNPPYHDEARHDVSEHAGKRAANTEKEGDLPLWIEAAARALKPEGLLTLIHRADRIGEIVAVAAARFGDVGILPIVTKEGAAPKRVIVRLRKDAQPAVRQCRSFVLHKAQGGYTAEAEAVLREMEMINFRERRITS